MATLKVLAPSLVGVAYMRRSQDSGTGVSEEIQDDAIRDVAERLDVDVRYWLPADLDASSFTMERPSFQEALELLAAGKANRLIAAKLNRLTRRRRHWEEVLDLAEAEGWKPVSAEFPDLDLLSDTGRMVAGMFIDQGEREYREKRKDGDNARRNAVLNHGVHGGESPPLGYDFTVRGYTKPTRMFPEGKPQRGPLTPNATAPKVRAAFDARAEGAPWKEVVRILGANSQGAAVQTLANRAYLGEARSGEFVNANYDGSLDHLGYGRTHPPLLVAPDGKADEALFARANRRRVARSVSYAGRVGAPLGGGILRCWTCRRALTRDTNPRGDLVYRCKNLACHKKVTIQAGRIEPVVLDIAKGWHGVNHPGFALTRAVEDAMLPALEDAHRAAEAEVEQVKSDQEAGRLTPSAFGLALSAAEKAVEDALRAVEDAEAGREWLGLSPEKVEAMLSGGDAKTVRSFVGEMVCVFVLPVGRGQKVPVKDRIKWQAVTTVVNYAAMPEGVLEGMIEEFSAEVEA
jgi:DNA invertase Pin-like site-specific DNA recombinase